MPSLDRLRQANATELRFRLACELRKSAGRLRALVSPERWRRHTLAAALAAPAENGHISGARHALRHGDWGVAHRSLARHFATRASRFPLNPATLPTLAEAVSSRFPDARASAMDRAERMLRGRYDILGYEDVPFGTPPDWHRDPVHERQPPPGFWSVVPYLDPQYGDHKIIWEINRHQHWIALGRAYQLTGDRRYYDAFVAQLEHWMSANPPLQGVNWASMLELGFRTLSWIWALHFFAPAACSDTTHAPPWMVDLLLGVDRQLTHIEENLSQYFSPNTHLSGEALALYVAGVALPELARSSRRAALGRRVLIQEIHRQVNADGGHAELSAHYHRYSTDFYLLATLVARLAHDPAASSFEDAARRQAGYLRAITDDTGRLPLIGDDDGGQLFPVCGSDASDCRDTLCSAAAILNAPALATDTTPESAYWFCGSAVADTPRTAVGSQAFPVSGYYVSRSPGGNHLIFDAGCLGYLNAGHAHADALSIVLTAGGHPFVVDAGTWTYTMDPTERDRFRSTAMHNTVVLDGRPQSEPRGPFHWASRADARCLVWESQALFDYAEGIHNGYKPAAHARAVLTVHGVGWIVIDHLLGPPGTHVNAELFWHIHPDWKPLPESGRIALRHHDGHVRSIACTATLEVVSAGAAEGLDGYSPVYGRREQGLCLRARTTAAVPDSIATFIPSACAEPSATVDRLAVTRLPGPRWHGAVFRLSWEGKQAIVLAATETSPDFGGGGSPRAVWGSQLATTDARVAFIQLGGEAPLTILGTEAAATGLA